MSPSTRESTWVCIAAASITIAWTLFAGKDASWDVINHHLYLPFSLTSGRYAHDLFAAGPQSYQNPIGYLPGYALIRLGLPAWLVGVLLAGLQAVPIAWGLHRITIAVWPGDQRLWRLMALAMAWVAPAFLLVVGTTSVDPFCAGLSLVALACVFQPSSSRFAVAGGGLAVGLAMTIKPTTAVFALAIGGVLLTQGGLRQRTWASVVGFIAASLAAWVATSFFWASWLWAAFGNPIYPLFNNLFQSPFAPTGPTVALRFLASGPWDLLTRMVAMAEFRRYTVSEAFIPDLRPILCAGLSVAALFVCLARQRAACFRAFAWATPTSQLTLFVLVSYVLWMYSSGNARYALALFLAVGLAMVRAAQLLLPERWALLLLSIVIAVQAPMYAADGDRRNNPLPWTHEPYVVAEVPQRLQEQPFLHLSLGMLTFSALALTLDERGAMSNPSGQMTLPTTGPLGDALAQLMRAWEGRTRFLFLAPARFRDAAESATIRTNMQYLTYRYGLQVDWSDCEEIFLKVPPSAVPTAASSTDARDTPTAPASHQGRSTDRSSGTTLLSCHAQPNTLDDPGLAHRMSLAEQVFKHVEAACPRVFGPAPLASEIGSAVIQRIYGNSDARLNVSPTEGVNLTHFRSSVTAHLGSIDHVIATRGEGACRAWQNLPRQ